jgi:hypothetical protein
MTERLNGGHQKTSSAVNPPAVGAEEVRFVLGRILGSRHFAHAPKKQKFLRLLTDFYIQGRVAELNEYLIGREVFDRDENYNPADDPIVRVGAHDVRKKLELYYQIEGIEDEVRLEIPVGSYEPVFYRRPTLEPETPDSAPYLALNGAHDLGPGEELNLAEPAGQPAPPAALGTRRATVLAGLLAGLLALATGFLIWVNLNLRQQVQEREAVRSFVGAV